MNRGCGREDIQAYVDGLLGEEAEKKLEEHAGNCRECMNEIMLLRKGRDALASLKDRELPEGYGRKLLERLNSRQSVNILAVLKRKVVAACFRIAYIAEINTRLYRRRLAAAALLLAVLASGMYIYGRLYAKPAAEIPMEEFIIAHHESSVPGVSAERGFSAYVCADISSRRDGMMLTGR